jgi:hypothetical protein
MNDDNAEIVEEAVMADTSMSEILVLDEIVDPELALPIWEATGNPEVDESLELIQALDSDNLHAHVDVLREVHGRLHELMANIDR